MITIHGRTADSNKLFVGPADWDVIRKVKNSVSIPVIANGGISCRDEALRCLSITGADGVMSSEGLLGNPKMFSEHGDEQFRNNFIQSQLATADDYLRILQSHKLPSPLYQVVRSHLFKMLYRFVDAPKNSDLRSRLATGDV
jgi:tRNA-dihydrouridine synthase